MAIRSHEEPVLIDINTYIRRPKKVFGEDCHDGFWVWIELNVYLPIDIVAAKNDCPNTRTSRYRRAPEQPRLRVSFRWRQTVGLRELIYELATGFHPATSANAGQQQRDTGGSNPYQTTIHSPTNKPTPHTG